MAVKDKIITVESLAALHEHNKETYMTKDDSVTNGDLNVNGDVYSNGTALVKSTDVTPIANGGTNATDGATGLKNLFASGNTVLSSYQYGDELPAAGTVGRIFFKKVIE